MNDCSNLPEPMRVTDVVIERCRREIESRVKRTLRTALLPLLKARFGFCELGEGFQWGLPLSLRRRAIRVGRYSYIGAYGSVSHPLVIGDLCMISTNVHFVGNDHGTDAVGSPVRLEFSREDPVTIIEADCWIGDGATIRAGVRIGRGAVVGAGAIVTKSVGPYEVVAGTPARLLRMRFDVHQSRQHDLVLYGNAQTSAQAQAT